MRYVLAGLIVSMPLSAALLAGLAAPPLLLIVTPVSVYVLGRTLLIGPALLARRPMGAARAVMSSWRWTRGHGLALALLAGQLMIGVPVLVEAVRQAGEALRAAHLGNPVAIAALDGLAAAIAAGATLALAMCVGVLYRRLAR